MEEVVLVNEQDQVIGVMDKLEAHQTGKLHRAFSIFLFNSNGDMLIQKRAQTKYHSGGLWTNACCSHPRPNEDLETAAHRRLQEELNLSTSLQHLLNFTYQTSFDNGLIEHELDHVFIGITDERPQLNPEEADDFQYIAPDLLLKKIKKHPNQYTIWFKLIVNEVLSKIKG